MRSYANSCVLASVPIKWPEHLVGNIEMTFAVLAALPPCCHRCSTHLHNKMSIIKVKDSSFQGRINNMFDI